MSMPGMMNTVLNLGLTEENLIGLATKTGNERFALDAYRRFIQMFGDVVMGIDHDNFEHILHEVKSKIGENTQDTDLSIDHLKEIIQKYKVMYKENIGEEFPDDPKEQLYKAIRAVFDSWDSPRAVYYRKFNRIPNFGTAVNVQQMVFGNMGDSSLTGVAFTRDPATGEKIKFGEYLTNAQGEDVVAGIRTPKKFIDMKEEFPKIHAELSGIMDKLEDHYKDMQDIEFTAQEGKLYLLQTRTGKRTALAMVKIAIDLMHEGYLNEEEAILRRELRRREIHTGPSEDIELQWATYFDAADQAGISRLYGGIHVQVDDLNGRIMGAQCGVDAWSTAGRYWDGSARG